MGNSLHWGALPKDQRDLLKILSGLKWLSGFYLAGGTALALQIGHRLSLDFDFFSAREFDPTLIKKRVAAVGKFELFSESEGTINGRLNRIQISFFHLPYKLLREPLRFQRLKIALKPDLAAMKLAAISSRGSRKDFVDLFFLLKDLELKKMFHLFESKYGKSEENVYSALKGLAYFKDAETQPMPRMLTNISWQKVKKSMASAQKEYIASLKR